MNYRHAFHAGNFADVVKHALTLRILLHLGLKAAPFRFIDTHAGLGLYDLGSEEAERTGEWLNGIGRMDERFAPEIEVLLTPWRDALAKVRERYGALAYPGSPALARESLRREDRAVLIEKHPADGARLRERFNTVSNMKVLEGDGWNLLPGLIPPKERRGLVLVDPPYEEPGELARAAARLSSALKRWPTGIFALWYPIKVMAEIDAFAAIVSRNMERPILRLDMWIASPDDPRRLNGCGLLVVNPPWTLAGESELLLPALAERFAREPYRGAHVAFLSRPVGDERT